mgnify:CR=1 FL=1
MKKEFTVEIRKEKCSHPIVLRATSTYEKGSMFCVRLIDDTTIKYPIKSIFDVRESVNE